MALRLVLGRSGAGKSRFCLDEIRAELRRRPDGPPLVLLVPEQATFQAEYALARTPNLAGTIRAQALSFRRLAFRVMQEIGGTALVPIGENGKSMLLYKIMHRLGPQLVYFQGGAEQRGLIERTNELLTELKRYGVTPEQLAREAADDGRDGALLGKKLHDMALIYRALEEALAGLYIDAEDYLDWLVRGAAEAGALREATVWVDGFHGFTPKEYEALGALMRAARDVTVTLTLDRPYGAGERPHELDLFHKTAETCAALLELAEQGGVPTAPPVRLADEPPGRFAGSPMLAHLERHYVSRMPMLVPDRTALAPDDPRCGVSLRAAANRRAEVEAAARDMVRRAQQGGVRWRDMTVMVRQAADYTDYIETVFAEYGIPYFLDQRRGVAHHPLVELIRSALETVTQGWRYEAVFRCVKTEMLLPNDSDISREELDQLENYALAAGIDGRRWLDKKSWRPLMRQSLEDEPAGAEARADARFERLLECRETIVRPLRRLGQALKKAGSVREMCEALYRLLDSVDAADRLERWSREAAAGGDVLRAREHRQLWDGAIGLLDQLVEMAGDEALSPELFAGIVEAGLDSLKLASVPPAIDQVLVGSMERTRTGDIDICYVLGANDGALPRRVQEDGVLTEQERERLAESGLRLAPGVRRRLLDERFLIYNALTAARCHLWISWALADEEGKSLLPSEVIRHIKQLFPGVAERTEGAEPASDMDADEQAAFVRHPARTLSFLVTRLRAWRQGEPLEPFWWDVYNWFAARPAWHARLSVAAASLGYRNEEPYLPPDTALRLFGTHLQASVSRMERFVACPFQHFAVYGLRLRERALYRLEAPDIGQLFHAALSRLTAQLGDRIGGMPPEALRAAAIEAVDELAPRLQSQILLSSGRFRYIAQKLAAIVAQTAVMLGEHARRAAFAPVGLEVGFGPEGPLPPLELSLSDGRSMALIGRIDRVDAAETEDGLLLRVLDYKSSATQLRLEDVLQGLTLQMLTYLDVVLTHAPAWLGRPAGPAGALYFHVHNPLLAAPNGMTPEEARKQLLKSFKTRGMLLAEERAVRLMDGQLESGHSELLPVALKKDGGFYGTSSVVSREQWDALRSAVRRTIRRIGGRIMDGDVSIAPYRKGDRTPCQFCAYKPVCHFDPLLEGNAYVRLARLPKERIAQLLEEDAAGAGAADAGDGSPAERGRTADERGGSASERSIRADGGQRREDEQ